MDKHQNISFGITIRNSGRILHEWHQSPSNAVPDARRANAICERFLGSVRRECLDHFLIFHEKQLSRFSTRMLSISIKPDPIKGLGSGFRSRRRFLLLPQIR